MKSEAKNFYKSLTRDPEKIIKWCNDEIQAYRDLIKLIEQELKTKDEN